MSNDLYEKLGEPISLAAKRAASDWHDLLEPEEIESEIWTEILASDETLKFILGLEPKLLTVILANKASRICIKERNDYEYFTGDYRYSINEARDLADLYFCQSGEELMAEYIDFEIAFKHLSDTNTNYAQAIFRRFALKEPVGDDIEYKNALKRGVEKITDCMNRSFKDRERLYQHGPEVRTPTGRKYKG